MSAMSLSKAHALLLLPTPFQQRRRIYVWSSIVCQRLARLLSCFADTPSQIMTRRLARRKTNPAATTTAPTPVMLRSAARKKRATFAFLELPPELRNMIYDFVLADGFDSVDRCIEERLAKTVKSADKPSAGSSTDQTIPTMVTPSVLLVCKTIHYEAVGYLRQKPLVFTHGLMDLKLHQLISKDTLRKVTHLVVADSGHSVLDERWQNSFDGHRRLAHELAACLFVPGHSLKKLELRFEDPDLAKHVIRCWNATRGCDMRQWVMAVWGCWRHVRDIDQVVIKGWFPEQYASGLIRLMRSAVNPILRLPWDVRKNIFLMAADNDIPRQPGTIRSPPTSSDARLSTPTVMLIDRQSSSEARRIILEMPFVIEYCNAPAKGAINILDFAGAKTLQRLQHLHIIIRNWRCVSVIKSLQKVLMRRHSLKSFTLELHGLEDRHIIKSGPMEMFETNMHRALLPLVQLRNVESVNLLGSFPDPFRRALKLSMESTVPIPKSMNDPFVRRLGQDDAGL